jgi:hypothetical protein
MHTDTHYRDTFDDGLSPVPDVADAQMCVFLAIKMQKTNLIGYWAPCNEPYMSLYSKVMKRDACFHILRFLHFTDRKETDKKHENFDRP